MGIVHCPAGDDGGECPDREDAEERKSRRQAHGDQQRLLLTHRDAPPNRCRQATVRFVRYPRARDARTRDLLREYIYLLD